MAVIAFAITLATFFLSGYFQLSATQASARALHGLFNNDRIYHHRHAIHGGVASESSVCSQIGIDLLRIGGNAADALVGTTFCIGVVAMYHSGIGGGGFMLVRTSNGTFDFVDFRETAPDAASETMYNGNVNASLVGGLASGVPGEVRGLEYVHKRYGCLEWATLLHPAIKLAREGFEVTEDLVHAMRGSSFLIEDPTWAMDFAPNGILVQLGDTMTRKRYADSLESLAREGPGTFYEGNMAESTISALRSRNGIMTMEDLSNYSVVNRDPVQINYRGYRLTASSVPSGGAVALSALKTVEGYADFGQQATENLSTHRLDEAFRFAFGERVQLGDPSFVPGMKDYELDMLSEGTAVRVRSQISDFQTLNVSAYNPLGLEIIPTPGTAQIVTTDGEGMAITLTTTVNTFFGSQLMVPETGVIMNNEMNDFSIPNTTNAFGFIPTTANYISPGKRPLSSVTLVIVESLVNSSLYLAIGAAGGSRIITATVESLVSILDQGLSATDALAKPRFHDQLVPNQVAFDWSFNNQTVAFMESCGHNVTWVKPGFALVEAIRRLSNGTYEAASDPNLASGGGYTI